MLVLTRKTNESIFIAGGIEVMVVQVRGNRVRLGFRAPSDVSIQRKERVAGAAANEGAQQTSQFARAVPVEVGDSVTEPHPR